MPGLLKEDMMETNILERGILLLDKPEDLTSMQCVEVTKKILKARKAGHSGTLDPKVTGLMLIAFNEATKAMPLLARLDKAYEGVMRIHGPFTEGQLSRTLKNFTGKISQTPPKRSAVVRKPRDRQVNSLEVTSIKERDVSFKISCEAGTYIRKLIHDIGEALGVGAHMESLRRTGIGPFTIEEAFTMEQLKTEGMACLIPLEQALERIGLPKAITRKASQEKLQNGLPLKTSELINPPKKASGLIGLYDTSGKLMALARLEKGQARPDRVFK
jgi:H/ACA ribonucleoprotein complex subunit 4